MLEVLFEALSFVLDLPHTHAQDVCGSCCEAFFLVLKVELSAEKDDGDESYVLEALPLKLQPLPCWA